MKRKIKVEIFQNQKKIRIDKNFIEGKIEEIKKYINPPPEKVSIYFLNNKKIKELNKKFLQKNSPTDVLTFRYSKNYGEIFISIEECSKNARIYGNTIEEEILYVIIHGFLHLKGYRDYTEKEKEKMFLKQEKIFKSIIENEKEKKS